MKARLRDLGDGKAGEGVIRLKLYEGNVYDLGGGPSGLGEAAAALKRRRLVAGGRAGLY